MSEKRTDTRDGKYVVPPASFQRKPSEPAPRAASRRVAGVALGVLLVVWVGTALGVPWAAHPGVSAWQTICVAIMVQAIPFLLLGTLISGAVNTLVPAGVFQRVLPRRPALAVPVASAAGVVLPGCECASVPVAASLVRRGVPAAAAFAFLLSSPAVNPVVLVSTAVAFPGSPEMVLARLLASLAASAVMGWLWLRWGRSEWIRKAVEGRGHQPGASRLEEFRRSVQHDFLYAGGFLMVGAMAAATFNVLVPRAVLDTLGGSFWLSVLFLAALAIVLAVCSEADAFVAASLTGFSPTARLVFMVVGPMVDVKLVALQAGTFGRSFALRFSTATAVVAVLSAVVFGWWLL
ncbi:permease [Streptomyces sp. OF3]|uniref:Permease n=1 Tax=Streptomyces alkaliterrae TaxID=2213162 RepID=A0A7W3WND6_9ACTN|nr:permease [Streptomyces alkaliterrae]